MDNELIQKLYDRYNMSSRGITMDEFTKDLREDEELQRKIYDNIGANDQGISFGEFQNDVQKIQEAQKEQQKTFQDLAALRQKQYMQKTNPQAVQQPDEPVDAKPAPITQEKDGETDVLNMGILENTWVGDFVEDAYRSARRGLASGAGVANSIQILARGAQSTDEDLSDLITNMQNQEKYGMSNEFKDFIEAKGFRDSWNAFWRNPITITTEILAESAFALGRAGGVAIAGSALTGPAAPILTPLALGSTSAALETSGKMVEGMQEILAEKGLEFNTENLREVFKDEEAWADLRNRAIAKGGVIGLVDAATAGIVSKIGGSGLVSKLVSQAKRGEKITDATIKATKRNTILKQASLEAPAGGLGELGGQAAAGEDADFKAAFLEVIGEIPGGAVSIGTSHIINKKRMGSLTVQEMANAVQNVDQDQYNAAVDVAQQMGQINQEQATELKEAYDELSNIDKTIPNRVQNKQTRAKITDLINKRKEIEAEVERLANEEVDEAFQDEKEAAVKVLRDEKDNLNEQIQEISKPEEVEVVEEAEAETVINDDGIEVEVPEGYRVVQEGEVLPMGSEVITNYKGSGVNIYKPPIREQTTQTEETLKRSEPGPLANEPLVLGEPKHTVVKGEEENAFREKSKTKKAGGRLLSEPVEEAKKLSDDYKTAKGLPITDDGVITKLDTDHQKQIADAFEEMEHRPNDPDVVEAYEAMGREALEQYQFVEDAGIVFEIYEGKGEPYANSEEMIQDVRDNKHMYILSTEKDFGEVAITDQQRQENPLLRDSGKTDKNGKSLLINDLFRGVHDYFGHAVRGNSFGAIGEENAWAEHVRMFSPKAARAMTTETRGQNSWVNFGPNMRNDEGRLRRRDDEGYLTAADRPFAEQKMGLLPEWTSRVPGEEAPAGRTLLDLEQRLSEITPTQEESLSIEDELRDGQFGLLTAENPNGKVLSDEENAARNKRAKAWLEKKSYKPVDMVGKYGNIEYSFYVPNLTQKHAAEFAAEFEQESVATDAGLVYKDGSSNPRNKEADNFNLNPDINSDFYSVIRAADGDLAFSLGYDTDTIVPPPAEKTPNDQLKEIGAERKALEESMAKEAAKLQAAAQVAEQQARRGLRFGEANQMAKDYDKSNLAALLDSLVGNTAQIAKALGQGIGRFVIPKRMKSILEEQLGETTASFANRIRAMEEERTDLTRQEAQLRREISQVDSSLPLRAKVGETTYQLRNEEGKPVYQSKDGKAPSKEESREILKNMAAGMAVRAQRTKGITSKELQAQIKRVKKALSKLVPTLKIEVLSNDEFAAATGVDPTETSRGNVRGNTILINGDKANALTVPHEAAHMVMIQLVGVNSPGATIIHTTLAKALRRKGSTAKEKALAAELDSFIANYEASEGGTDVRAHEFFAELVGFLSANKDTLSKDSITKQVVKAINDLLENIIGMRPLNEQANIDAIIDFTNTISGSLAEGTVIKDNITPDFIADTKIENDVTDASFNQAVEVFEGVLEKLGINVEKSRGRITNRNVAEALHEYYKSQFPSFEPTNFSEEAREKYISYGTDEAIYAIQRWKDASGVGWYTADFQAALDTLAEINPVFATTEGRAAATLMTAITSAATAIDENFRAVPALVASWENTGRFDSSLATGSIASSIETVNLLLDQLGSVQRVEAFLTEEVPVSQSKAQAKEMGIKTDPGWPGAAQNDTVDMVLPRSVSVFGPKIGAFYANLSGVTGLPTIDRWFIRTAYRYGGDAKSQPKISDMNDFKKQNGLEGVSNESALVLAAEHNRLFQRALRDKTLTKEAKREIAAKYRKGAKVHAAAKGVVDGIDGVLEAKQARDFRGFWNSIMGAITDKVNAELDMDLTIPDVQAVLWLLEKRLYGHLGVTQKPKSTYSESANQILAEQSDVIPEGRDVVEGEGPQGEIQHDETQDVVEGLDNRAFDQLAEDITGIDDMIRDMHNALPNLSIAEKVQLLNAGGVNITEQQFKNVINGTNQKRQEVLQGRKGPKVQQRRQSQSNPQDAVVPPGALKAVNDVVRDIRQKLYTRQSLVSKLIGRTTIESIFREAARRFISLDGSGSLESKIVYQVLNDEKIPSAAEEVAMAYRAMKLQEARFIQKEVFDKADANGSPKADYYLEQLAATEAELEHVLKAIEMAGSRTGLALRIRQEILTFDRFSAAGIEAQMIRNRKGDKIKDAKLSTKDKQYARQKSNEIQAKEDELRALEDKKQDKSENIKENIAAAQLDNMKQQENKRSENRKRGKPKSFEEAKKAFLKHRKNYDC